MPARGGAGSLRARSATLQASTMLTPAPVRPSSPVHISRARLRQSRQLRAHRGVRPFRHSPVHEPQKRSPNRRRDLPTPPLPPPSPSPSPVPRAARSSGARRRLSPAARVTEVMGRAGSSAHWSGTASGRTSRAAFWASSSTSSSIWVRSGLHILASPVWKWLFDPGLGYSSWSVRGNLT